MWFNSRDSSIANWIAFLARGVWGILPIAIISEPGLNPIALAERAGVSERTLRRDLAELRELGYEVAYTSGYEVQEKLNLEGRARPRQRSRGDDALLQAVANAVETAGLWRDTDGPSPAAARRRKPQPVGTRPLVLIPSGEDDADFLAFHVMCQALGVIV